MVVRKPLPSTSRSRPTTNPSSAPYPISPQSERPPPPATSAFTSPSQIFSHDLHNSPAFNLQPLDEAQKSPVNTNENPTSDNPWANEIGDSGNGELPSTLRVGDPAMSLEKRPMSTQAPSGQLPSGLLPPTLQAGYAAQKVTPRASSESDRSEDFWDDDDEEKESTNKNAHTSSGTSKEDPFAVFKTPFPGSPPSSGSGLDGQGVANRPVASTPPPLANVHTGSSLPSTSSGSTNPFRRKQSETNIRPNIPASQKPFDVEADYFADTEPPTTSANLSSADRQLSEYSTSYTPAAISGDPESTTLGSQKVPPYKNDLAITTQYPTSRPSTSHVTIVEEQKPTMGPVKTEQQPSLIPVLTEEDPGQNPWSDPISDIGKGKQASYIPPGSPQKPLGTLEDYPDWPPSLDGQKASSQTFHLPYRGPAPASTTETQSNLIKRHEPTAPVRPVTAAQLEKLQHQRSETYQIKHFNWADAKSGRLRRSSMLIQNKNGPCPLLALVNALILSSIDDSQSALGKALASREHISLGLIIESLMDELTSDGRNTEIELPDVDDLNRFLLTLHTGLNANPRFATSAPPANLMDARNSVLHLPTPDTESEMGRFEMTGDIRLYGAFNIPVVHGWLPQPMHSATSAFSRSAQTYEDAQTILFGEEELESRLSTGLSSSEEQLLQDIVTIKDFFKTYPTQLTPHGLRLLHNRLGPGSFAIFFRNDHFSTIFKHPNSGQIFTLVTDAGYATHSEVIWESLVDISGQGNDFYSGDFRPVGNSPEDSSPPRLSVPQRQSRDTADDLTSPKSPVEQEQADADFALALQLQDEEEQRAQTARRNRASSNNQMTGTPTGRRTSRPSQQDIRPSIPPRRQNANQGVNRPEVDDGDAPPPSYDEAAKGEPYIPPEGNPNFAGRIPSGSSSAVYSQSVGPSQGVRQRSEYQQQHAQMQAQLGQPLGRPSVDLNGRQRDKDRDCIVM